MCVVWFPQALHYWRLYEDKYERIQGWVKAMEKQVKDCPLRATLEEKQEQLKKYQVWTFVALFAFPPFGLVMVCCCLLSMETSSLTEAWLC